MILPLNQAQRATPDITATSICTPDVYRSVVQQFRVADSQRYAPLFNSDGSIKETWCNIFAWDVTSAMGAEIPHWVSKADGSPADPIWGPGAEKFQELSANAVAKWLATTGISKFKWRLVTRDGAFDSVNNGAVTVATFLNTAGHGHIAVVLPNAQPADPNDPTPKGQKPIRIAQAGARNFFDEAIERGFGRYPVVYFTRAA